MAKFLSSNREKHIKMPLIIELHNLAGGLGMCSFLLMNKLVIKRKSNAVVTTRHRKKDRAFKHLVKEGA